MRGEEIFLFHETTDRLGSACRTTILKTTAKLSLDIEWHAHRHTIRKARLTNLIPLELFHVMHMRSLRKIIPLELSDVMIT